MKSELPPGWSHRKLDELGFVGRGRSRHRPRNHPSLYGGPYPFFQTGDVKTAELYLSDYNQTYNEKGLAQSKLWEPGSLCITIAANIAESAILKIRGCFPDSIVGFIADPEKADVRFVKYAIDTMKLRMQSISRGTTQDNLSLDKLLTFDFLAPPLPTQRKIAAILSAYDDLIENNTLRIAILEAMAQAIYREWFVHFGFPGHEQVAMVDSELGPIPEGWEVASILDVPYFRFVRQNVRSYEGTKRYFATADVRGIEIVGEGIEYAYEDKPSRAQKNPVVNSVWFARMKETYKVLPFTAVNEHLAASSLLSSGFAGFEATDPNAFGFLFFTIDSDEFHERKDLYCTGATQMSLNNEGLGRIELIVPDESTVTAFGRIAQPMVDQILILQARNSLLRRTRDLLLPRLISGEVDVSDLPIDTGGLTDD